MTCTMSCPFKKGGHREFCIENLQSQTNPGGTQF